MIKGINLTLMIGPVLPVPVPQTVIDALDSIEVTNTAEPSTPGGFELNFNLNTRSPLHTLFLLSAGGAIPLMRVIIIATLNGMPEVLMDGVITKQDVVGGSDVGHSVLRVTGTDITGMMNLIPLDGFPYPAMPIAARVLTILAKYAIFGVIPIVIPPLFIDVPIPVEWIPRQQGTDLEYLNQLADEVGHVFYADPGPVPGTNRLYWGPSIRIGIPQPALNADMDAHKNIESIQFTFDAESKKQPVAFLYIKETKIPIPVPIPDISPLSPPLGLIPPLPLKIEFLSGTAKMSPMQAAGFAVATAAKSSDAVNGSGTLNVLRYGRILKAHGLVGVRGVGMAFDGLYFVKSVKHKIKRGEYKQDFTLTRNGLISTVPRVPA